MLKKTTNRVFLIIKLIKMVDIPAIRNGFVKSLTPHFTPPKTIGAAIETNIQGAVNLKNRSMLSFSFIGMFLIKKAYRIKKVMIDIAKIE
ncbi:hypothetical protein NX720_21980 [Endozoicomonas euniceicola]|uniref:Uncharacterized protein n=1 Tax=Endozoicomonas euniceicola TaxID=1234143 RepID=A0ABY6GSX1_9GAMM|nr:hypothetical protein [Endozoicomonas euniceicola]UYM15489.1 hypothetical protein NX720_21980 [Endozoicomonas euniceicola]